MTAKIFSKELISWYQENARDLPWRRTKDPYKIWISEIMLQQTTVNAVIPYYERWIKTYPTIHHVARIPLQKILRSWQGLGYYSRARNIHKTAKIISNVYGRKIPQEADVLRKLPGFGPYTVGAVMSIAFDKRAPIIDANVRRVIMRQMALRGEAKPAHDKDILKFLNDIMPLQGNNIFNQALMELGALVCLNRSPLCLTCPVLKSCVAYRKGIQEIIPAPKKKNIKKIDVAVAVIKEKDKYFIQRRPAKGLLAGLWEFPGGKIEKGESPKQALLREVEEELGVKVREAKFLMNVVHFYTEFRVTLHVFDCVLRSSPNPDASHKWASGGELAQYPMPSGSVKIVASLKTP